MSFIRTERDDQIYAKVTRLQQVATGLASELTALQQELAPVAIAVAAGKSKLADPAPFGACAPIEPGEVDVKSAPTQRTIPRLVWPKGYYDKPLVFPAIDSPLLRFLVLPKQEYYHTVTEMRQLDRVAAAPDKIMSASYGVTLVYGEYKYGPDGNPCKETVPDPTRAGQATERNVVAFPSIEMPSLKVPSKLGWITGCVIGIWNVAYCRNSTKHAQLWCFDAPDPARRDILVRERAGWRHRPTIEVARHLLRQTLDYMFSLYPRGEAALELKWHDLCNVHAVFTRMAELEAEWMHAAEDIMLPVLLAGRAVLEKHYPRLPRAGDPA